MKGASVTKRSTETLCGSSERAMSITLLAPCEWPTRTRALVFPAARSLMISLTAVDQCKCPATSALIPLALSSAARPSMPVENTPNQPRSSSTWGSAASAQLHHSRVTATARNRAANDKVRRARAGTAVPRRHRPVRAIISAIAPARSTAVALLRCMRDIAPFLPHSSSAVGDKASASSAATIAGSVARPRVFPHYRGRTQPGIGELSNPYAVCLISPPDLARNLPDTRLSLAPQNIRARAGLLSFFGTHPTRRDSKFFSRLCAKHGDIRSILRLGRERRFLASHHQFSVLRRLGVSDLHRAPADARLHGERLGWRAIGHGARVHCATARE